MCHVARPRGWMAAITLWMFILLAGCSTGRSDHDRTTIHVSTSLPVLALILQPLLPESAVIDVLLKARGSAHDFMPTPSDAIRLQRSKLLILAHPHIDGWSSELAGGDVYYLSDWLESSEPHFWMDPVLVRQIISPLTDILCERWPEQCVTMQNNRERFESELNDLHVTLQAQFSVSSQAFFVASHEFALPFAARYGLSIASVIEPHPGHEPSPAALIELIDKARQPHMTRVVAHAALSDRLALLVATEGGTDIMYLDPGGGNQNSYSAFARSTARAFISAAPEDAQ